VNFPSYLNAKPLSLRTRNDGLHLVRVRAFRAAPMESGRHVKIGLSRLHAAIGIRSAHNQCRVDLAVRTARNRAAVDVVTRDPTGTAGSPRELHLVLCDACARQRFNHRSRRSITAEGDTSGGGSGALWRERHRERCTLSGGEG
jgi:hypothetical protein